MNRSESHILHAQVIDEIKALTTNTEQMTNAINSLNKKADELSGKVDATILLVTQMVAKMGILTNDLNAVSAALSRRYEDPEVTEALDRLFYGE